MVMCYGCRKQRCDFPSGLRYDGYIDELFMLSLHRKEPCAQCDGQKEEGGARYCGVCGRDLRQVKKEHIHGG